VGSNLTNRLMAAPWLLLVTLAIQIALSMRLVWSNTAFVDEATYLYAGHQEIHSILADGSLNLTGHSGYFQTYFSGAPVLYPVLGALADSVGGLAGARLLSLFFMLCATILLYMTAQRMYDRRAAGAAAVVFVVLGPTQFLGALATYDAMALALMALAGYLVVKSCAADDNHFALPAAAVVMVIADATKYAVILFDPVIVGLAVLASVPNRAWPEARRQAYRIAAYSATLAAIALGIGGHTYVKGLLFSTLARASGTSSALLVLGDSWRWVGGIAVMAAVAIIVSCIWEPRVKSWTCTLLGGAILLAPLEQARIHTTVSLQKHVDFGAWFAALAVGYAITRGVPAAGRWSRIPVLVALALMALTFSVYVSVPQAAGLYQGWISSSRQVAALKPWVGHGNVLAEDYFIYAYYLEGTVRPQQWYNTWKFTYADPASGRTVTGLSAYRDAIAHHYFGTVALSFGPTSHLDHQIVAAMTADRGYREVARVWDGRGWFEVFEYVRGSAGG
jgi:hypothetical protein